MLPQCPLLIWFFIDCHFIGDPQSVSVTHLQTKVWLEQATYRRTRNDWESDFSRFFILFHSIYNEHSKCRKIEPANNILIPLWKINFFAAADTLHSTHSVGSLKKAKMKWIFSSSFIHRVHIVHSIYTQSNQQFCMQPKTVAHVVLLHT